MDNKGSDATSRADIRHAFDLDGSTRLRQRTDEHVADVTIDLGGDRLAHGVPTRRPAPGRRGYQWIESVEVRRTSDYGQWWAIFASGFG